MRPSTRSPNNRHNLAKTKFSPEEARQKLSAQIQDFKSELSEKLNLLTVVDTELYNKTLIRECTLSASEAYRIIKEAKREVQKIEALLKVLCCPENYLCISNSVLPEVVELSDSEDSREVMSHKARKSVPDISSVSAEASSSAIGFKQDFDIETVKAADSEDSGLSDNMADSASYGDALSKRNTRKTKPPKNGPNSTLSKEFVDDTRDSDSDSENVSTNVVHETEAVPGTKESAEGAQEMDDVSHSSVDAAVVLNGVASCKSTTDMSGTGNVEISANSEISDDILSNSRPNGRADMSSDESDTEIPSTSSETVLTKEAHVYVEKLTDKLVEQMEMEHNVRVIMSATSGNESDYESTSANEIGGNKLKKKLRKRNKLNAEDEELSELAGLCRNPLVNKSGRSSNKSKEIKSSKLEKKGKNKDEKIEDETMNEDEANVDEYELNSTSPAPELSDNNMENEDFEDIVADSLQGEQTNEDEPILPELEEEARKDEKKAAKKDKDGSERGSKRRKHESKLDKALKKHNALNELKTSSDDSEEENKDEKPKKESAKKKKPLIMDSDYSGDGMNESDTTEQSSDDVNISEYSDSDSQKPSTSKGKKRKKGSSDWSGSEAAQITRKKGGPKKKRSRVQHSSSQEGSDDDGDGNKDKNRKKIRKIMKDSSLSQQTVTAEISEKERNERLKKRQQMFNQMSFEEAKAGADEVEIDPEKQRVILDKDENGQVLEVDPYLAKKLKKHQVEGVLFLYQVTFESLEIFKNGRSSPGGILAHCMGLGKSFQVITYLHTMMHSDHFAESLQHVLILCPANVILTWDAEFTKWLECTEAQRAGFTTDMTIYKLTAGASIKNRMDYLSGWKRTGGVFIMGYDMYRILVNFKGKGKQKQNMAATFLKLLRDPGPDMVICDEGHKLKGDKTALTKALVQIKTKYRVCLTGTPLQNNLMEYYTMISFVKPNLLGTKSEFANRFANPIKNGQHSDSSALDVKIMKRRSHVLYDLLNKRVLRRDYSVLKDYLKAKREFVVLVRPCDKQKNLYNYFLENVVRVTDSEGLGKRARLLADYHQMMRIWTHPFLMLQHLDIQGQKEEKANTLREDDDFIDDDDSDESEKSIVLSDGDDDTGKDRNDSDVEVMERTISTRNTKVHAEDVDLMEEYRGTPPDLKGWWEGCSVKITDQDEFDMTLSGKISVAFNILKQCEQVGDKLLIFSQSLEVLDLLEGYLEKFSEDDSWYDEEHPRHMTMQGEEEWRWSKGKDFLRIDGGVSAEIRKSFQDRFNRKENLRARLMLLSTRAASVGTNLIGANRVIVFDACWNPSHDTQSLFRVYRFGQVKPVYIYRLVAQGTMEECIYRRQVAKEATSLRVVDEAQVERHFKGTELVELYHFEPKMTPRTNEEWTKFIDKKELLLKDRLFSELLLSKAEFSDWVVDVHEHDSLLQNKADEKLTVQEKEEAWAEYERAKKGNFDMAANNMNNAYFNAEMVKRQQAMFEQEQRDRAEIAQISSDQLAGLTPEQLMSINTKHLNLLQPHQTAKLNKVQKEIILRARQICNMQMMAQANVMQMQPIPRAAQDDPNKPDFPLKDIRVLPSNPQYSTYDSLNILLQKKLVEMKLGNSEEDSQMNQLIVGSMTGKIMPLVNRLQKDNPIICRIIIKEVYAAIQTCNTKLALYNCLQENIPTCAPELESANVVLMTAWNSARLHPPNDTRVTYDIKLRQKMRYIYDNADMDEDMKSVLQSVINPILLGLKEPLYS